MSDLHFGSLVAEDSGQGFPVVMIHGLGGTSNSFEPLLDGLDGHRVIRPDLPGAGRSGPRPGLDGIAGLARAVTDLLRASGIERAVLVGHSMGTLVCQHMAANAPERVAALVLYGAILEPPQAARTGLRDRAAAALEDGMAGIADAVSRASLSASTRARNPAARAFVRESLMRQNPEGYAAHCRILADAQPCDHARIACPVTLVTGEADPVAPPAMAEALCAALPDARLIRVPDCGHWPMIEAPAAARAALSETLSALRAADQKGRT
jgi:pimeloyl-ACP methyl ester carboxylesterase